jgi:hypothetical protein
MKKILNILFLFLFVLTGCDEQSEEEIVQKVEVVKPKLTEPVVKEEVIGDNLTKISDPKKVAELRKEILRQDSIKKQREFDAMKDKPIVERYKLGDTTVIAELIDLISYGEKSEVKEALKSLQQKYNAAVGYQIKEWELQSAILELINDPSNGYHAIQLAGIMRLDGYADLFEEEFLNGESKHKGRLFYWLSSSGKSLAVLSNIEEQIKTNKLDKKIQNDVFMGLRGYAASGNKEIKTKVLEMALAVYNKKMIPAKEFDDLKGTRPGSKPADNILYCIFKLGEKKAVSIISNMLKKGVREGQALSALIRINGKAELKKVEKYLADSVKYEIALRPALVLHRELGKDSEIPKTILTSLGKHKNNSVRRIDKTVNAFIQMGQVNWFNKMDSVIKSKELIATIKHSYSILKNHPKDVANALNSIGLEETPYSSTLIAKAKSGDRYFGEDAHIYNMLHLTGFFVDLDTNLPSNELVSIMKYLFENSDSTFVNSLSGIKYGEDSVITITLIHNDNAYLYSSSHASNNYLEIITLLNQILEDNNASKKYCHISSKDQTIQYLFGHEDHVELFKEKFELSSDTIAETETETETEVEL